MKMEILSGRSYFSVRNDAAWNAGDRQLCIFLPDRRWGYQCCDKRRSRTTGRIGEILGTETHSLSKPDAWRKAVASVRRREMESEEPYMYILSTDGFANSYTSDEEYQKTCKDYLQMIQEHGAETVQANLKNWLTETSELGCGDDITVVMVYFTGE